jgi:hypothetical protein
VGSSDLASAPALGTATYSYDSTTHVATWVYRSSLPLNKYLLSIPSAAVTSVASGQALDGEFINGSGALLPSGDAVAGGNFNFRFNILPGDVDQTGVVTGTDGGNVRQHFLQFTTTAGYKPLYDTYGKGAITGIDLMTVQGALLSTLPATDPVAPGGGGINAGPAASPSALAAAMAQPSTATPTATSNFSSTASSTTTSTSSNSGELVATAGSTMPSPSAPTSGSVVASAAVANPAALPALSLPKGSAVDPAAHDAFFAALGGGSPTGGSNNRLLASPSSVTALNSLALTSSRHGGWMQARDDVFARLDSTGGAMTSVSLRSRKSKQTA